LFPSLLGISISEDDILAGKYSKIRAHLTVFLEYAIILST
jgi:hypothetical protein